MPENGIPDTMSYLLLGLGAVAVIMGGLVASIVVRYANLRRDIEILRELNPNDI